MNKQIKIGIEKYDCECYIPIEEEMSLEDFRNSMEKVFGPIKLNIFPYQEKKNKKMKDICKEYPTISLLNNENLGHLVQKWKGNFININNSCFKDSYMQTLIHSLVPIIVEKEENKRKNLGLPTSKNFKDYINDQSNNEFWVQLLKMLDIIKNKIENKDSSPIINSYDLLNLPPSQSYQDGGNYFPKNVFDLSQNSSSTSPGLRGGSFQVDNFFSNPSFMNNHEIYINKKTVVSDSIRIEVRSFQQCKKCNYSNISVICLGNISLDMYDFLNSKEYKTFDALLKYYYKVNDFGKENLKTGENCPKCKKNSLEFYNKISTLPEALYIDFNWLNYYNKSSDYDLENECFEWILQEEISLFEHYDRYYSNNFQKKDCFYQLTSFIGHYGDHDNGHFINFSKIDNIWYCFDDLQKDPAIEIGDFNLLKYIVKRKWNITINGKKITSQLRICLCIYEKNKCKGYENYIQDVKAIVSKQLSL